MITEQEKLEVLHDELEQRENLEYEILQKKMKKRRQTQQVSYLETEHSYTIISEDTNFNQLHREDY